MDEDSKLNNLPFKSVTPNDKLRIGRALLEQARKNAQTVQGKRHGSPDKKKP